MKNRRTFLKHSVVAGLGVASSAGMLGARSIELDNKPSAMIVSTTAPRAIRSGLDAMRQGGTAADAVLTTALEQIAICAGCWVSFAGRMTAMYFDATEGSLHALNACYDAPRNELDPSSIPRSPEPTGRSVLVPGFMAGVQALHDKFGKLDFAKLFTPTIELAENGFQLTNNLARLIRGKKEVLTRFPEGREVFLDENENLYSAGDQFKQPLLAKTMRQVAEHGAAYMYEGDWGRKLIEVAQREGGRISLEDLKKYSPAWSEPLSYQSSDGLSVHGLPTPNRGGPIAIAAINLAVNAELTRHGHYTESLESLKRILKIEQVVNLINWDRGRLALSELLKMKELTRNDFADANLGKQLWKMVQSEKWPKFLESLRAPQPNRSEHSDAVVAVDPFGNVAAILHTINTAGWGTTGLFVDGVSIPDSGASQQNGIAEAGPGGRMADHGPPLIAMRDGRPVLAGSATGSGNVNASWQNFIDVLLFGMNAQEAADSPNFYRQTFEESALNDEFVRRALEAGISVKLKKRFGGFERGFWAGIGIDQARGTMDSGKIRMLDGISDSY